MNSNSSRPAGRRNPRGGRRSHRGPRPQNPARTTPAPKPSLWQRFLSLFSKPNPKNSPSPQTSRPARSPEQIEVTSPRLYVGNLSFQTEEEDLLELFRGVGSVQNAEIATHRDTQRSKGFGFVTLTTIEEARRAVVELHDREFMGRKLVVSGAKSQEREPSPRV